MINRCLRILLVLSMCFSPAAVGSSKIKMKDVRVLAKEPVNRILAQAPIEEFTIDSYWKSVNGRNKPLVVFFYSNRHSPSQRVATLIRYIAPDYADRMAFAKVQVADKGSPGKKQAEQLNKSFSLDNTPGILFYDNVNSTMVLEDEDYIDADFKEFRTPSMLLWRTYYSAVRKELDALLAD